MVKNRSLQSVLFSLAVLLLLVQAGPVYGRVDPTTAQTGASTPAAQAERSIDCYAMDVVFIVDQSGSMSGKTNPPQEPNDPNNNRSYAPRYSLNWLANNRLGTCQNSVHRVGMISYGRATSVDLPVSPVSPNSQREWETARAGLEAQIQPREMGDTDPLLAFQEAAQMLKSAPPLQDGVARKKAIILLTDGKACVASQGCLPTGDSMNHAAYNQRLQDYVMENFPFSMKLARQDQALKAAVQQYGRLAAIPDDEYNRILSTQAVDAQDLEGSVYIWVVAMNSASNYLETDGDMLNRIASTHGGELINLEENQIAVPRAFNEILSWMAGVSPEILRCGPLPVFPYLSGAVLDVFKLGEGYEVKISYQDKQIFSGSGDTVFFGVNQYTQFGAIEHYTFRKPPAGLWNIQASDCDGIQASFIPFTARLTLQGPKNKLPMYNLNGQTADPKHPFRLAYKITDQSSEITLDPDPRYPIDITATITDPAGKTHPRKLAFSQDGLWESVDALPVHLVGQYSVSVTGIAACVDAAGNAPANPRCQNGKFTVFSDTTGRYQVGLVQPFDFQILTPSNNATLTLHDSLWPGRLKPMPVEVTVRVVDANGKPIPAQNVLATTPDQAFHASLAAGTGSSSVVMVPDLADPSLLHASLSAPAVEGSQTVTVGMQGEYRYDQYIPMRETASVAFSREDPLTRRAAFWYGVAGLVLALLLILALALANRRRNAVYGSISLGSSPEDMFPAPLPRRRVAVIQNPPCGLAKIEVRNAPDMGSQHAVSATIYPRKGAGAPSTWLLVDGAQPISIGNGIFIQYYRGG